MKRILSIVAILCFTSTIFAQENETSKIDGFRTFKWGQILEEMTKDGEQPNFIETEKLKDGAYYILAEENLMIGNVLLSGINYVFSKKDDKFFKVVLTGKKIDVEQMQFIVDYKYGEHVNETERDDKIIMQWIVEDVTITLIDYKYNKFELILESNWEAVQAFKKNTNVSDF